MSNNNNKNNNNSSDSKNLLEKKNWKMYASLALYALLGLALGYAIAKGALHLMNRSKMSNIKTESNMSETNTNVALANFATSLSHNFEGDNKAEAAFDYSDANKVTASLKTPHLYTVNNEKGAKVATVYFYFNGGRGATPEEYVTETIKKSVPAVSAPANANYGLTVWTRAESGATEWHLKTATNKDWLIYVESATANNAEVSEILKSVDVK